MNCPGYNSGVRQNDFTEPQKGFNIISAEIKGKLNVCCLAIVIIALIL